MHDALMLRESKLTKAEKEMIVVTVSGGNECHYCVVAHGAILRIVSKNSLLADQLAINYRKADISERQRIMLDFAVKVSQASATIGDEDFENCGPGVLTMRISGTSAVSARFLPVQPHGESDQYAAQ